MLGDMRIGVKQSLVEEAIASAASTPTAPIAPAQVRHAVMLEADLGSAVRRAFAGTLAQARMALFHPLGFMLASPVDTPEEAIARFTAASDAPNGERTTENVQPTRAFLEDKYDGMRAQLHCGDPDHPGRVALYSRNREDITASFPELAEAFAHVGPATGVGPLILDGEILAWNFGTALETQVPTYGTDLQSSEVLTREARPEPHEVPHALPFATLGQRIGRKRVSNQMRTQIPVIYMAFDLLYAAGELTLNLPLRERRLRLESIAARLIPRTVAPLELDSHTNSAQASLFERTTVNVERTTALPRLILSPTRLITSAEDIDRAYLAARARSNEGVMIKAADSTYQPGRRGLAWVKLKRELATLDVVITGAEYGHGKRAGLLSDYTFAVRGPHSELLNVGKAYSGVTDAEIADLTEFLKAHTLEDQGHFRTVEPLIVLEVAFNNIMRSPRHSSGFALRFPRILRLRPDKPLAEIDTLARVEAIYQSQIDKPAE
jgi:DNA ligase-1